MSSARRYLDVVDSVATARANAQSARTARSAVQFAQIAQIAHAQGLGSMFALLQSRCPNKIDHGDWQQAVKDGSHFLARWGVQAARFGWTARDLFGLHAVSDNPSQNYRRLSRYDETGLIWLLRGRPVVMLADATAAIENPSGAITIYRKHRKPPLGSAGRVLDDFR
jgi:hypothetical protein